jgi:hypothetical protein
VARDNPDINKRVAGATALGRVGHPHQALHTQNQWQGRALHPDRPQGMGLCSGLPHVGPPC